ncbi:hypothetical protein PHLGIDRAFT_194615 [Phlebiopsis gigantea 11061_1 CR5-6]|uniref:Uncharacterized protein n=1 Tax=Phlebiopsis gigantea (strain 11061_1 CR5-6) TaxID=745531 RepID=A0A0C3NHU5_PHLG1|nr:hypothetical protein PHLGIDRAFT_194615 [Phlebiopsis gigantea 11061_1 CR5-6]
MAPVPSQPAPSLNDFYSGSPRVFWGIFGVFAFASLILLIYGFHSVIVYIRMVGYGRSSSIKKPPLRSLLLPHIVSRDLGANDQSLFSGKKMREHHSHIPLFASAAPRPRRPWLSITALWPSLSSKRTTPSPSHNEFSASRSPPSTSKAWVDEHDRYWAQQLQIVNSGGPLCTGELLPWIPYIPQKSGAQPAPNVMPIAPPPQCHVKGSRTFAPATSTPKISSVDVVTTIEEVGDDTTLEEAASTLFNDVVWSCEPFGSAADDTSLIAGKTRERLPDSSIPAIVIRPCSDAPRPVSVCASAKLPFEVYEYGVDYLQIPVPGEEPLQSRTILGTVNRSTHGGRFALGPAPPRRRSAPPRRRSAQVDRPPCYDYDENAPAPGRF